MGIKDSTDIQTSQRLWYKCFYERVTCFECTRTNAQNCAGNSRQGKFLALFKSFFADYQQPFIERQRVQLRTASEGIIRDNFQVVGTDNFFQNLAMAKCRPIDMTNTFSEMYFLKALTAVQGILSDVGNTVRNLDLRQAIASGKASLSEIFQLLRESKPADAAATESVVLKSLQIARQAGIYCKVTPKESGNTNFGNTLGYRKIMYNTVVKCTAADFLGTIWDRSASSNVLNAHTVPKHKILPLVDAIPSEVLAALRACHSGVIVAEFHQPTTKDTPVANGPQRAILNSSKISATVKIHISQTATKECSALHSCTVGDVNLEKSLAVLECTRTDKSETIGEPYRCQLAAFTESRVSNSLQRRRKGNAYEVIAAGKCKIANTYYTLRDKYRFDVLVIVKCVAAKTARIHTWNGNGSAPFTEEDYHYPLHTIINDGDVVYFDADYSKENQVINSIHHASIEWFAYINTDNAKNILIQYFRERGTK